MVTLLLVNYAWITLTSRKKRILPSYWLLHMHHISGYSVLPPPASAFVKSDYPVPLNLLAGLSVCITLLVGLHVCNYVLSSQGQWAELTYILFFPQVTRHSLILRGYDLTQKRDFSSDGLTALWWTSLWLMWCPSQPLPFPLGSFVQPHPPHPLCSCTKMNVSNQTACKTKYYPGRYHD